ncbi:hypothetical protein GGR50DRAFT_691697 [Xylaria sp. CBS 124048]|nr:hypothetical protein GGR50DRAFT_691697 [Xylaria sp. CBS 124048]
MSEPTNPEGPKRLNAAAPKTRRFDTSNPAYKRAASRYTRFMVAMPILLVSTYYLFDRLALGHDQIPIQRDIPATDAGRKEHGTARHGIHPDYDTGIVLGDELHYIPMANLALSVSHVFFNGGDLDELRPARVEGYGLLNARQRRNSGVDCGNPKWPHADLAARSAW